MTYLYNVCICKLKGDNAWSFAAVVYLTHLSTTCNSVFVCIADQQFLHAEQWFLLTLMLHSVAS